MSISFSKSMAASYLILSAKSMMMADKIVVILDNHVVPIGNLYNTPFSITFSCQIRGITINEFRAWIRTIGKIFVAASEWGLPLIETQSPDQSIITYDLGPERIEIGDDGSLMRV